MLINAFNGVLDEFFLKMALGVLKRIDNIFRGIFAN